MASQKIALVHDWIEKYGGAEVVLDQLARVFPQSDLYVLWSEEIERYGIPTRQSFLANSPLRMNKVASVPFQLLAWRTFRTLPAQYEKLVVSSHLFAHHVRFQSSPNAEKFVYAHTPARYIWEPERDGRGDTVLFRLASKALKPIDRKRAQEAFKIAANSLYTKGKIQKAWGRDAEVIHPPVGVSEIVNAVRGGIELSNEDSRILESLPAEFILGASRFVEYKKLEKAITLGEWLKIPVVIAGSGPLLAKYVELSKIASIRVIIIERPSDNLLLQLYARCLVYFFPPEEDFGVMPVEASAAGAPVLANRLGGAAETVVEGINGALVDMESKSEILSGFDRLTSIDKSLATSHVLKFDSSVFQEKILKWVGSN